MKKTNKVRKRIDTETRQCYIIALIPILLIFIFSYIPMFGVILAFKNYKYNLGIFGSEWVGFENFKFLVLSNDFPRITWNTLYMNFFFIITGVFSALFVAILLYNLSSRLSTKIYQTMMIVPHFLSWVIVAYMAYALLQPQYGILNNIRSAFGMEKIDWYSEPGVWPPILIIAAIWKHVGMDCVVYYASLMGIDSTLFEAAELDGANKLKIVKHIMIPELLPLITILTILKIGSIFRADFGLFYQLPRNIGALYETTDVIDTYVYRTMRELGDMGLSSAAGLLQSVVGFVLVITTNAIVHKIEPENSLF